MVASWADVRRRQFFANATNHAPAPSLPRAEGRGHHRRRITVAASASAVPPLLPSPPAKAEGQTSSSDGTTQAPAVDTSPPTAAYDWESYQASRKPWWAQTASGLAAAGRITEPMIYATVAGATRLLPHSIHRAVVLSPQQYTRSPRKEESCERPLDESTSGAMSRGSQLGLCPTTMKWVGI